MKANEREKEAETLPVLQLAAIQGSGGGAAVGAPVEQPALAWLAAPDRAAERGRDQRA